MVKSGHGFQLLSTAAEYENPYFKILKHELKRPNGKIKPYWTVSRFEDFSVVIPIFPENRTILVGQYRPPVGQYSWEFPMGQVIGKNPLEMAKQELIEETGIRAQKWQKIGHFWLAPGHHEQEVHVYIARNLTEGKSDPGETEVLKIKKLKISEIGKMIESGKIKDGPTIAAFHLVEKYL